MVLHQVLEVSSADDFEDLLQKKPLVFVELFATKCRKCYALMGKYSQLASTYENDEVAFIKVACDKVQGVAEKTGVSKTPTFQVYVHGEKVDELVIFAGTGSFQLEDRCTAVTTCASANCVHRLSAGRRCRIDGRGPQTNQIADCTVDAEGRRGWGGNSTSR
jgi:thiol-disulfide isomerase/thioredoxin